MVTLAKNGWHAFDPEPPGVHLVSCLASVNSSEEMSQQGESWEQILINRSQAVEALAVHQDKKESFPLFCSRHRHQLATVSQTEGRGRAGQRAEHCEETGQGNLCFLPLKTES